MGKLSHIEAVQEVATRLEVDAEDFETFIKALGEVIPGGVLVGMDILVRELLEQTGVAYDQAKRLDAEKVVFEPEHSIEPDAMNKGLREAIEQAQSDTSLFLDVATDELFMAVTFYLVSTSTSLD